MSTLAPQARPSHPTRFMREWVGVCEITPGINRNVTVMARSELEAGHDLSRMKLPGLLIAVQEA